jgi:RimJ/RimL family protein N-acetyltransferase
MNVVTLTTQRGEVRIRPTSEGDAQAYRDLRLAALRAHPEAFGADYESLAARPIEHWQERMRAGAGGDHGITYVAEAHGELIGMTVLQRGELPKLRHWANIFGVYVQPAWRGTGIPDALIEACAAHASALGLRLLKLGVVTTNANAIRLYQRCGFRVYGVEPEAIHHVGVYYDELLMVRQV